MESVASVTLMSAVEKKSIPSPDSKKTSKTEQSSVESIMSRRSRELFIGICGAIGSGAKRLHTSLATSLQSSGYEVVHVRISDLIISKNSNPERFRELLGFERYNQLQDEGNRIRKEFGNETLAELAIQYIAAKRQEPYSPTDDQDDNKVKKSTKKIAYIIDQFKHPSEVNLFRLIYPSNFYLIGLLRTEISRRENLRRELISDNDINILIEKDKKDSDSHGQQVQKTLHLSDYFIRNLEDNTKLNTSVKRLMSLIHGVKNISPTFDEQGMFSAFSASLRSACLSRQVGAAIMDDDGSVISTGCNDVPKSGGGLYSSSSSNDHRCYNGSGCHNDIHKNILRQEIKNILNENIDEFYKEFYKSNNGKSLLASDNNEHQSEMFEKEPVDIIPINKDIHESQLKEGLVQSILHGIFENTKAKSIIEYSRAVHAEMDAITSLAKNSNAGSLGKTMYCTTYPCHICTRHIIAAGIKRVVFIEPYEKSLALQLHGDSICHPDQNDNVHKVSFENFEGVSFRRYARFFAYNPLQPRKNESDGSPKAYPIEISHHVDSQYLDGYTDYELKVSENVEKKFN